MGFSYKPIFRLLVDRDMKKTDLNTELGLSSATVAKLSKGEPISGESMERLCLYFRCQPGDLVEYDFTEPDEAAGRRDSAAQLLGKGAKKRKAALPGAKQANPKHK